MPQWHNYDLLKFSADSIKNNHRDKHLKTIYFLLRIEADCSAVSFAMEKKRSQSSQMAAVEKKKEIYA